jgi:hypothetical protein
MDLTRCPEFVNPVRRAILLSIAKPVTVMASLEIYVMNATKSFFSVANSVFAPSQRVVTNDESMERVTTSLQQFKKDNGHAFVPYKKRWMKLGQSTLS